MLGERVCSNHEGVGKRMQSALVVGSVSDGPSVPKSRTSNLQ